MIFVYSVSINRRCQRPNYWTQFLIQESENFSQIWFLFETYLLTPIFPFHKISSSGNSSAGRAPPCQGGGRGFEPRFPLHYLRNVIFKIAARGIPRFKIPVFYCLSDSSFTLQIKCHANELCVIRRKNPLYWRFFGASGIPYTLFRVERLHTGRQQANLLNSPLCIKASYIHQNDVAGVNVSLIADSESQVGRISEHSLWSINQHLW